MCELILLNVDISESIYPNRADKRVCATIDGVKFRTAAAELLTSRPVDGLEHLTKAQVRQNAGPYWAIDEYLVRLVCQCTAVSRNDRPALEELTVAVEEAIARRGFDFHKIWQDENDPWDKMSYNPAGETDEYIQQVVRTLFLNADADAELDEMEVDEREVDEMDVD